MKILKIENGQGFFYSFSGKLFKEIDLLDKESLFAMVDYVLKNKDADVEPFIENKINKKAQIIVYKEVSSKLLELISKRDEIINGVEMKYAKALEKYAEQNDNE